MRKRVDFFLLVYRAGSPAHHNGEVEGVRLVPLDEAEDLLAYPGERAIMRAARDRVRALTGDGIPATAGILPRTGPAPSTARGVPCTR